MKNRNTSIILPTVNGKRHGLVGLTHFGEMSGCPCLGGIVIFEVKQFSVMPERGNMTLLVACQLCCLKYFKGVWSLNKSTKLRGEKQPLRQLKVAKLITICQ